MRKFPLPLKFSPSLTLVFFCCKFLCFFVNFYYNLFLYVCLSILRTTPIEDIKTSKLVEPAEMNGNGSPVGGIEPVNTS